MAAAQDAEGFSDDKRVKPARARKVEIRNSMASIENSILRVKIHKTGTMKTVRNGARGRAIFIDLVSTSSQFGGDG
jgi:hypothetical protein